MHDEWISQPQSSLNFQNWYIMGECKITTSTQLKLKNHLNVKEWEKKMKKWKMKLHLTREYDKDD